MEPFELLSLDGAVLPRWRARAGAVANVMMERQNEEDWNERQVVFWVDTHTHTRKVLRAWQ